MKWKAGVESEEWKVEKGSFRVIVSLRRIRFQQRG